MAGQGGEPRGIGLHGNAGFGSLKAGGDAHVPLALLTEWGRGQAAGFGSGWDLSGFRDEGVGFLDFRAGLGGFGLRGVAPVFLELAEATLGFGGFTAEADGSATKAQDMGHGQSGAAAWLRASSAWKLKLMIWAARESSSSVSGW